MSPHLLPQRFFPGCHPPPQSFCCQRDLDTFLQVASKLGMPVAMEKVEGPLTAMSFLGLILDSVKQEIRLPPDSLAELTHELDRWSTRRKATKRELLSLIGKLSFAARAVPVGHLFMRRLITLASTVAYLHHRIRLNAEALLTSPGGEHSCQPGTALPSL